MRKTERPWNTKRETLTGAHLAGGTIGKLPGAEMAMKFQKAG
jgi:hypothetical protein